LHPDGIAPPRAPMCSNSIGRLDRVERGDQRRSHKIAYPRHRIWLQRRRDSSGNFSIKSTKVQSFDDTITGAKRPQSLNSGNRTIRGQKCPEPGLPAPDGRARSSPPHDFRPPQRLAWLGDPSIRLTGSVCGRRSRPASQYSSTEKPADDYFAPHRKFISMLGGMATPSQPVDIFIDLIEREHHEGMADLALSS